MLTIHNLTFRFGSRVLYENASLQIKDRDRIGLIGANGTGKSTLLRMIVGEYQPDEGVISRSNDCTIGFLNQDLLSYLTDESILDVAMQAFGNLHDIQREIDDILKKLETDYTDEMIERLGNLQAEFEGRGGYTMKSQSEEILEGLGFATADLLRPLREFSGGWRMRVMLAKLLLQRPSLLMLDEPTNHLDLPSIEWLENYLTNYQGAVIVVSHDRYFLDKMVNTIVDVTGGELIRYAGNYEFFLEEKAMRQELQKSAFDNQQKKIKQQERFIERFKAKASKATQVQSRVKALDKLERIEDVEEGSAKIRFRFSVSRQPGKIVYELNNISKNYGDLKILHDSSVILERGDKIALIGANGRGKSTLLRIIAGSENIEGERKEGYNVIPAFFAQHQLEALTLKNTLIEELYTVGTEHTEAELRNLLGCFLFEGDDVYKKVQVLSGGEKSRVAMAKTLLTEANFLLLDEPTNHLDMVSVNILIAALQKFEGSYVVVSHDRHFISAIANKIWYIEDKKIKEYPGTYEEYAYWQSLQAKTPVPLAVKTQVQKTAVKQDNKPSQNSDLKKLKADYQKCEEEIAEMELKLKAAEEEMSKPSVYSKPEMMQKLVAEQKKDKQELEILHKKWEDLFLKMEQLS